MALDEFKECAECSAKTGSPTLCESCLTNRDTIGALVAKTQALEKERDNLLEVSEIDRETFDRLKEILKERKERDYGWAILLVMIVLTIAFGVFVYCSQRR